ncbi:MAG: hypothetical protein R3F50_17080 [Gammaproteobacteria bacterium]
MRALISIVMAAMLTSCATDYSQYYIWNTGGFTETELQPNLFNVRFRGNELTSLEPASEFSMLRAAELCLARGMTFMEILDSTAEQRESGYTPGPSTTNANETAIGNSVFVNSTTTYNPTRWRLD